MSFPQVALLTFLAMVAFAANSILCRAAIDHTDIDPASFTTIRLVSGAVVLWLIVTMRQGSADGEGNWKSAMALFVYAAGFSFAYISLPAATGALILFAAVQTTMIGYGIWSGERLRKSQILGVVLACAGLVGMMMPGLSAPSFTGSVLMISAGVAWGIYSLRGRGSGDPTLVTSGNFLRAAGISIVLSLMTLANISWDVMGFWYAVASGAVASGIGYAIWYKALPSLRATTAATVQLSVPVVALVGGILFLGEPLTLRFVLASVAILGGIAMVIHVKKPQARPGGAK